MTCNANIFKCLIFLGKIFSKKLDAPAYLTVLKDGRALLCYCRYSISVEV